VCVAQVAARIRHEVRAEVGVTCSCGIAVNKMLAKVRHSVLKPKKVCIAVNKMLGRDGTVLLKCVCVWGGEG